MVPQHKDDRSIQHCGSFVVVMDKLPLLSVNTPTISFGGIDYRLVRFVWKFPLNILLIREGELEGGVQ